MGDTRTPATAHGVVVAGGVLAMAVAAATLESDRLVASLAWVHSGTYLAGAVILGAVVSADLRRRGVPIRLPAALGPQLGAAVFAAAAAALVVAVIDAESRIGSLGMVVVAGAAAAGAHAVVQSALGGLAPTAIVGLLRREPPARRGRTVSRRVALQLLGPSVGGIRRHVAYLRDQLRESGWEVRTAGPAGVLDDLDHVVPIPDGVRPDQVLAARRSLRPLLDDVDLLHAHGLKAGWVAASVRPRPALVVSVHNLVLDDVAGRSAPLLRFLEERLPGRADATIAVSGEVARRFAGRPGADRIHVVPPAGPPPRPDRTAEEVRAELGVGPGEELVVTAARLHPQKGLHVLLDAAASVSEQRPDLRWFVFGEGPLRAESGGRHRAPWARALRAPGRPARRRRQRARRRRPRGRDIAVGVRSAGGARGPRAGSPRGVDRRRPRQRGDRPGHRTGRPRRRRRAPGRGRARDPRRRSGDHGHGLFGPLASRGLAGAVRDVYEGLVPDVEAE